MLNFHDIPESSLIFKAMGIVRSGAHTGTITLFFFLLIEYFNLI